MASDLRIIVLKLLLDNGELYGLELIAKSQGRLKRGSIYVTLDRMEDEGLIESKLKETPKGQQGPSRRVYKLTGLGSRTLRTELEQRSAVDALLGMNGVG